MGFQPLAYAKSSYWGKWSVHFVIFNGKESDSSAHYPASWCHPRTREFETCKSRIAARIRLLGMRSAHVQQAVSKPSVAFICSETSYLPNSIGVALLPRTSDCKNSALKAWTFNPGPPRYQTQQCVDPFYFESSNSYGYPWIFGYSQLRRWTNGETYNGYDWSGHSQKWESRRRIHNTHTYVYFMR